MQKHTKEAINNWYKDYLKIYEINKGKKDRMEKSVKQIIHNLMKYMNYQ